MSMTGSAPDPITTGLRWTARILGLGILGLVVLFYVGTGGLGRWRGGPQETALMLAFMTSVAGLPVAWRRELLGGALNVGGMGLFYLLHLLFSGRVPQGGAFGVIIVPGLLHLLCAWREGSSSKRAVPAPD